MSTRYNRTAGNVVTDTLQPSRGSRTEEGGGGVCKVKKFPQKSKNNVKFLKMYLFKEVKDPAWKVKKVKILPKVKFL